LFGRKEDGTTLTLSDSLGVEVSLIPSRINDLLLRPPPTTGAVPEYSYWDGKKYDYVAARKKIYCKLYATLVEKTPAFGRLKKIYESSSKLYLWV